MRSLGSRFRGQSLKPGRRLCFEPLESRQLLTATTQYEAYLKAEVDYESTQVCTTAWISQQLSNHSNTASSNGNHVAIASLAADEALLCQRNPTTYASYGAAAVNVLQSLVNDWWSDTAGGTTTWNIDTGFFFAEPLFTAVKALKTAGALDPASQLMTSLKEVAKDVARPFYESNAQNRAASAAAGTACAIDVWTDLNTDTKFTSMLGTTTTSSYATWWDYVAKTWSSITTLGDSWDQANNYNNIYLGDVIRLADFTGNWAKTTTDPNLLNMFTRHRDSVSPAGNMPCYGDDYSGVFGLDRFDAVFERIGAQTGDGTFRWAAQQLFNAKSASPTLAGLMYLGLALDQNWINDSVAPVQPGLGSEITRRAISYSNLQPDALILNPSRAPGQPMVASTGLWAVVPGQDHMHPAQAGAITMYEAGGALFLHAMGYHNERPEFGSEMMVSAQADSFPYVNPIPADFTTQTNLGVRPSLLASSVSSNAAGDQYGMIKQGAYFSSGTTNTRRMVLLKEGVLVVLDKLLPDATLAGQYGGPIWQLAVGGSSSIAVTGGSDWIDGVNFLNASGSGVSSEHLLIKSEAASGRSIGVHAPPSGYYGDGFSGAYAAYADQVLQASVPAGFVTVLEPHDAAIDAATAAAGVTIQRQGADAATAQVTLPGNIVATVTFNADGTWSVTRQSTTNQPPTVATAAKAATNPVAGTSVALSVLGADDAGESGLKYTWATTGTPPASVSFSTNATNAAKNTVATFIKAGAYNFQVTITDAGGLSVTSPVSVTVSQTLTSIAVTPASVTLNVGATQQFAAVAKDQFGAALAVQPALTWAVISGGGSITSSGLFTAPTIAGTSTIRATSGSVSGSATVTTQALVPAAPTKLVATKLSGRKVKLTWTDNASNETGFYVQTSTDGVTWTLLATLSPASGTGTTATYTTDAFAAGKRYFRVLAYNAAGTSAPSNADSVKL